MKLNAYILAADPAWIEASVLSYYDIVDRIVVSYDENSLGWTGVPIDVAQCLKRLRAIDPDNKMVYRPGHYARSEYFGTPITNDSFQRQTAADEAGEGADWVLQIDTDEVVSNAEALLAAIEKGQTAGAQAIEYPSIYLYQQAGPNLFLEESDRLWKATYGYPGPMLVRPGSAFCLARRITGKTIRFAVSNTPDFDSPENFSVRRCDAILHYSWVRSPEEMQRKLASWGHSKDRDWTNAYRWWTFCGRHPYVASIVSQSFRRWLPTGVRRVRLTRIKSRPGLDGLSYTYHAKDFRHHRDLQSA